jgi:TolB-like protein
MKNLRFLAGFMVFMALAGGGNLNAQSSVILDEGIRQSAAEIEGRLPAGSKIVILNFTSPSVRLADYVIDELTGVIVNSGKITVVDRQNLALIQQEMNFQLSGEVSDDSAQEIGRKLGAQSIVSGSIEDLGNYYRLRFRVIEVVSAAIQIQPSKNVRKDSQITNLMRDAPVQTAARPASSTSYPNGLNFSTGHKVGAGFLNLFFWGTGSFTMGDWAGGLIVGGLQLTSEVLWIAGIVNLATANEYVESRDSYGYYDSEIITNEEKFKTGTIMLVGSTAVALVQIIVGFVRPYTYDTSLAKKNGTYYTLDGNPAKNIRVAIIPEGGGVTAMNFTCSFSY